MSIQFKSSNCQHQQWWFCHQLILPTRISENWVKMNNLEIRQTSQNDWIRSNESIMMKVRPRNSRILRVQQRSITTVIKLIILKKTVEKKTFSKNLKNQLIRSSQISSILLVIRADNSWKQCLWEKLSWERFSWEWYELE